MSDRERNTAPCGLPFEIDGYSGATREGLRPLELAATIERVGDPRSSIETLHWGRNYLYVVDLETEAGPLEAVVKQFPNQSLKARLRKRRSGSLAYKSWQAAHRLLEIGVATPEPLLWVETSRPNGPSYYVSRRVDDFFEARYLFRALNAEREGELFPQVDLGLFFRELGSSIRRLHDHGFWHRDLTVGNVLVRYPDGPGRPELFLVDLNRGRQVGRLSERQRAQDLGRLPLFRRELQGVLLESYWGEEPGAVRRAFYLAQLHGFVAKNRFKAIVRAPFKALRGAVVGRTTHAHIKPPAPGARVRERAVWDELSDQPHLHATNASKALVRLRDGQHHLAAAAATVSAAPAAWRRYRELTREPRETFHWGVMGLAVSPSDDRPQELLSALEESGAGHLLVRVTPWSPTELDRQQLLARQLADAGYDLTIAVPQSRELVVDAQRWRSVIEEVGERFSPFARAFQIGQAINRAKWGVWNYSEYLRLAEIASDSLRARYADAVLVGPAVIDFEHHATAAVLNMKSSSLHFDVVSALLYVDRRGAPENRQLGFDTTAKCRLLAAVAETSPIGSPRCWITEFNWPLWEGPHSPAGKEVSVDEERQADYLVRYYLLALGSGAIERAYWWQLAARGYGLIDPRPDGWRRRPSFRAFATLQDQLANGTWLRDLPAVEPARLVLFRHRSGEELVVGWSAGPAVTVDLPGPVERIVGRGGESIPPPSEPRLELRSSPVYCYLAEPVSGG